MNADIFISYRRSGGDLLAHILYEYFTNHGYSVFQDVESLRSGKFEDALHSAVSRCTDFILILSPNCLDECSDPNDWIRREVQWALNAKKNIIPVMLHGFHWPESLPDALTELKLYNAISLDTNQYEDFFKKLVSFLRSSCATKYESVFERTYVVQTILITIIILICLTSPLITIFLFQIPFGLFQRIVYFAILIIAVKFMFYELDTRPSFASYFYGTLTEQTLKEHPDVIFGKLCSAFGKKYFISVNHNALFNAFYSFKRIEFGTWDGKQVNYLKMSFSQRPELYYPSCLYLHARSTESKAIRMLTRQGFLLRPPSKSPISELDYFEKDGSHVFLSHSKHLNYILYFQCSYSELQRKIQEVRETIHD